MRWKTSSRGALRLAGWVLPICLVLVAFSALGAESSAGTSRPFPFCIQTTTSKSEILTGVENTLADEQLDPYGMFVPLFQRGT